MEMDLSFTVNINCQIYTIFLLPLLFDDDDIIKNKDGLVFLNTFYHNENYPDFIQDIYMLYEFTGITNIREITQKHKEKDTFVRDKCFTADGRNFLLFVHRVPEYLIKTLTNLKNRNFINIGHAEKEKVLKFWKISAIKNIITTIFFNPYSDMFMYTDKKREPILKEDLLFY